MKHNKNKSHPPKQKLPVATDAMPAKGIKPKLPDCYHKKSHLPQPLVAMDIKDFVRMPIPVSDPLLGPWLMRQSLCMIHAARGVGKTYLALWIAMSVAAGKGLFGWTCSEARKVVYLDGEMPAHILKERFRAIRKTRKPADGMFKLVTPDFQPGVIPDLSTREGLEMINAAIEPDTDLIVVDNLSCWTKSGREDADTWAPTAEWALRHRAEGRSIIFIHHSGKSMKQRGTSRREDLLDVVMALKKSPDASASEGASFEIRYEKNRHLFGQDVAPINVRLAENDEGIQGWKWKIARDQSKGNEKQIFKLIDQGLIPNEVAKKLGVHRSTVSRALKKRKAA